MTNRVMGCQSLARGRLQTKLHRLRGTAWHRASQAKIVEAKMVNWCTLLATARHSMRILELENRCTGNRTVGSNPTLLSLAYDRVAGVLEIWSPKTVPKTSSLAAPLLDKLARSGKSHSMAYASKLLWLWVEPYLPSVKSQFGTKSSSRLFLVQGKLMGGRARKHLRENSHVQDRTHSSGEDALTVRGVGSRRTCNPVLDSDVTDAGQRPNCTGSGADNGSLCLYD